MDILSEFPDDTIDLNISWMRIQGPLDFSRFTKLKKLECHINEITELNNLPNSLEELKCSNNVINNLNTLMYHHQLKKYLIEKQNHLLIYLLLNF